MNKKGFIKGAKLEAYISIQIMKKMLLNVMLRGDKNSVIAATR